MSDKTVKASNAQDDANKKNVEEVTQQEGQAIDNGTPETPIADAPVKKANRRSVAGARGTQRLKFTNEIAKQNGLFIGHLASVEITDILIGESTSGMPSFNGLNIPKITFTFCSNEDDPNKRHFQTLQFTAVESNVLTIPGGKDEWKVNNVFDWFKHILNVYVLKGRELTEAEQDALSLTYEDFDEQGEYVPVEPETVIESWKVLFENVENMLNRNAEGKPVYKTKEGKFIPVWIKLLRYTKHNKKGWIAVNNGDLAFPTFVGEGCIEIFKTNMNPSIRLDIVKEAIIPMNIDKPKVPNVGSGIPSIGDMPGSPMGNFGGSSFGGGIGADAADDVPF